MIIDSLDKTINLKIVYFGPAMSGKTTTLKALFRHFGLNDQVCSIESTVNRTLFFDYGTITFQNKEWKLKQHIYSTTGQDFYLITRPTTLKGVDGIIFVADSQKNAYKRDLISWNELTAYYKDDFVTMAKVIAFNKQDVPGKFETALFLDKIKIKELENVDLKYTIALNGEGVLDSFHSLLKLIFNNLYGCSFAPEKLELPKCNN
ncbi:MAG: hypothetical protein GF383_15085 [Candidatus Lokiarchaeota archaeon]|nr:hypothetical protein [Candidatus Lokiarchaeota archaeon]MBD3342840.1 hypothetical protein [Candidatus Lokiarchaeota archaeon]